MSELKTQILPLKGATVVRRAPQPAIHAAPELPPSDVERGLHRVYWRQGLPLTPQHMQQQTRYHERHVEMAVRSAFDHPWGIAELSLNEQALAEGRVVIERLAAIFEDEGTPIVVGPSGNARVAPRSFDPELRVPGSEVDVYLGLPLERADDANVGDAGHARFAPALMQVRDFNTGRDPIDVEWQCANLRLMSGAESHDHYDVLRIARLQRTAAGRVEMVADFAPPSLRLHASPALQQALASVQGLLVAARTAILTQQGGIPDLARSLILSTLGEFIPALSRVLGSPSASAREAFDVMTEAVGALSAYAPRGTISLPVYDHAAPGPCFAALAVEAKRVLYWVAAPPFRKLPMERTGEDGVWVARLSEPAIFGRPFLLVVAGPDSSEIYEKMTQLARVGAADELPAIMGAHVKGVGLTPEVRRLYGLPLSSRSAAFRFDAENPASKRYWSNIIAKGTLAIAVPAMGHGEPVELSFFVENERE